MLTLLLGLGVFFSLLNTLLNYFFKCNDDINAATTQMLPLICGYLLGLFFFSPLLAFSASITCFLVCLGMQEVTRYFSPTLDTGVTDESFFVRARAVAGR